MTSTFHDLKFCWEQWSAGRKRFLGMIRDAQILILIFQKSGGVRACCHLKLMASSGQWATWSTSVDSISLLLANLIPPVFIFELTCPMSMKNLLLILSQNCILSSWTSFGNQDVLFTYHLYELKR